MFRGALLTSRSDSHRSFSFRQAIHRSHGQSGGPGRGQSWCWQLSYKKANPLREYAVISRNDCVQCPYLGEATPPFRPALTRTTEFARTQSQQGRRVGTNNLDTDNRLSNRPSAAGTQRRRNYSAAGTTAPQELQRHRNRPLRTARIVLECELLGIERELTSAGACRPNSDQISDFPESATRPAKKRLAITLEGPPMD